MIKFSQNKTRIRAIHSEIANRNGGLQDISTPDFSTPSFSPRPFNPGLFNHELFNPRLFNRELFNPRFLNPGLGQFCRSGGRGTATRVADDASHGANGDALPAAESGQIVDGAWLKIVKPTRAVWFERNKHWNDQTLSRFNATLFPGSEWAEEWTGSGALAENLNEAGITPWFSARGAPGEGFDKDFKKLLEATLGGGKAAAEE